MPLVIMALVLIVLVGLTLWSNRRTRRRVLGGTASSASASTPAQTPQQAANELRASIDAMNGRGYL